MTDLQHFEKIIKDIKFAMLTTVNASDKTIRSRPMTLQEAEFDGDLWFFAGKDSPVVSDIGANQTVNLTFADVKNFSFMSACGEAEVTENRAKAEELWNPTLKAWFPKGLEDPNLCLIKVSVNSADYWESPSSKIVKLIVMAKAVATGQRAGPALGKHGHIDISTART